MAIEEIDQERLDNTFRFITGVNGVERGLDEYELEAGYSFIKTLLDQMKNDYSGFQDGFFQVKSRLNRHLEQAGLRKPYLIEASGDYGSTRYGLPVEAERIVFC